MESGITESEVKTYYLTRKAYRIQIILLSQVVEAKGLVPLQGTSVICCFVAIANRNG